MSWKESKVRVLTHQSGLQGLQVLSAENKKPSDIQDVFLLQSSNSTSNAAPQTSLPVSSLPSSSSHPSLASVKFKIPLPPSASSASILPHHQYSQRPPADKSLILHNLPSDVSCVPIISSNNPTPRVHQFQMQEKPPSISALLKHQPIPLGGNTPNHQVEPQRSIHPISNYSPVNNIKTEHPNILELSQTVCNQLPRSTTLTPAVCVQQPPPHPPKEESTTTLTLSSLLPSSLSIIPTSTTSNLNQGSTRLDSPSSQYQCIVESLDQNSGPTPSTELMPPPPPPPPQSHSRNTTSPSANVSSTSEDGQERDIGKKIFSLLKIEIKIFAQSLRNT